MKPIISLIIATYGRYTHLENMIESLSNEEITRDDLEVIILDQNHKIDIGPIVDRFSDKLSIKWIRTKRRGLSYNKNFGIQFANGRYIAFPDDDCVYYSDTLRQAVNNFQTYDVDVLMGRVYNRYIGRNTVRNSVSRPKLLNRLNVFWDFAFVVISTQNPGVFAEKEGPGRPPPAPASLSLQYFSWTLGVVPKLRYN